MDACNGSSEPFACSLPIHGVSEARDDIAGIGGVEGLANLGALVELVQLPLGGFGIQVCHALAHDIRAAWRQKKLQPFDMGSSRKLLALIVHPENAEG